MAEEDDEPPLRPFPAARRSAAAAARVDSEAAAAAASGGGGSERRRRRVAGMAEEGDEAPASWSQARMPPLPRGHLVKTPPPCESESRRGVKLPRMEEECDEAADLWSQAWAPRSPLRPAKRRAPVSQSCSSPDSSMSQEGSAISDPAQAKALGGGQWWSTELAAPVEVGVDFVPDSQDGDGNEFFFLPESDESAEAHASRGRSLARGRQRVVELRRLFPPLPSLVEQFQKSAEELRVRRENLELLRKNNLLAFSSINTSRSHSTDEDLLVDDDSEAMVDDDSQAMVDDESQAMVDDDSQAMVDDDSQAMVDIESESTCTTTWSGSKFKSNTGGCCSSAPVLSTGPSSPPCSAPVGPCGDHTSGMSPSSKSGGPFRSSGMAWIKRVGDEDGDEERRS